MGSHLLLSHLMESRLFLAQMTTQFVSGMQRHFCKLASSIPAKILLIPYSAIMAIFFQHTSFQMITGSLVLMKIISSGFLPIFLIHFPIVSFLVLPVLLHFITLMTPILFMVSSGKSVFQMFCRVLWYKELPTITVRSWQLFTFIHTLWFSFTLPSSPSVCTYSFEFLVYFSYSINLITITYFC